MDTLTPSERSERMGRVRCKDTKPELTVRALAHSMGYRFRLHVAKLPGCPDLVFPRYKKVIFVHGCFWHRHPGCRNCRLPKSRVRFWKAKLERNRERDLRILRKLRRLGWGVLVIWECETNNIVRLARRINIYMEK